MGTIDAAQRHGSDASIRPWRLQRPTTGESHGHHAGPTKKCSNEHERFLEALPSDLEIGHV